MSAVKKLLPILKTTFTSWNKHEAPRLGAALAFYTILSLSPLIILVVAVAGLIFSRSMAQAHILSQVQGMIGAEKEGQWHPCLLVLKSLPLACLGPSSGC
jgi:membrane protein